MAKKNGGVMYNNPFNESGPGENADTDGDTLYFGGYDEVLDMHLTQAAMGETPNTNSGKGILGGPAPGEVNPADLKSP